MKETRRLIVEDRQTNKRVADKLITPNYLGEELLALLQKRYQNNALYRMYWSVDTFWDL